MSDEFSRDAQILRLRKLIAKGAGPEDAWETAWKDGVTPWDRGHAQEDLVELVKSRSVEFPSHGRALVPGCGKGYDAAVIASHLRLQTLGIDISTTAVEEAKRNIHSSDSESLVSFQMADFFSLNVEPDDLFDLVYDYTFFCAIQPSMRVSWGKKMTEIAKPGALLITLVFPIDGEREGGPPFSVKPEIYREVLGDEWVQVFEKETIDETFRGRKKVIVWRKVQQMSGK